MIPFRYKIQMLLFVFAIGLISCSTDEETVIIPKTLEQYKTEYSAFVTAEKAKVENCVVGYNKGNFRTATKYDGLKADYLTVLNAAVAVLAKTDVTIPDIINSGKTLATPGKAFAAEYYISDRRALNDSIVAYETLNAATIAGTASGQVPAADKTTFTNAITTAKTMRSLVTAVDRQVADATDKLYKAKIAFKAAIIK